MTRKELYRQVTERFSQAMPQPRTELRYGSVFQLLVAVILSAQCTDKRINLVTPALFAAYPDAAAMAAASEAELYEYIKSVSYPNNKTRSLLGAARAITERFGGEIPSDIDSLMSIPGVGRKTANVMLSVAFGQSAMAVDTHVFRVSDRIGLTTRARTPLEAERQLTAGFAPEVLATAHHWLILHGRYVCKARTPLCKECVIADLCRYRRRLTATSHPLIKTP